MQPWNYDCLLIWGGRTKCKMKRDPVNGALLCLVRLWVEVFHPPTWSSPFLFWTLSIHNGTTSSPPSLSHADTHQQKKNMRKYTQNCLPQPLFHFDLFFLLVFIIGDVALWKKKQNNPMQGSQWSKQHLTWPAEERICVMRKSPGSGSVSLMRKDERSPLQLRVNLLY